MIDKDAEFTVTLDKPRRVKLTLDSVAAVEEERGMGFVEAMRAANEAGFEQGIAEMIWIFCQATDPGFTRLEAGKIVQEWIMKAPIFLRMRRLRDLREAARKAAAEFQVSWPVEFELTKGEEK